ncbi:MAG: DUF5317 family protein [Tissierellia bacterium]|nr:DUF5317 family protein [Tissierellia bacterium]
MILEGILVGAICGILLRLFHRQFYAHVALSVPWWSLGGAGLFLFLLWVPVPHDLWPYLHSLSLLVMGQGLFWGKFHPGKFFMALGFLANGLVVFLNKAMPVDLGKLSAFDPQGAALISGGKVLTHRSLDAAVLPFLGDIIYYNGPFRPPVLMSGGDVLIAVGLGLIVTTLISQLLEGEES